MPAIMYQTFLDESGIDKTDVCVVAGLLGGTPAQAVLADEWRKVLTRYKVAAPFHSVQFYAPAKKIMLSTANPYRGWSNFKKKMFMDALVKAIEKANVFPVGCGVDSVAFQNRNQEERRALTGGLFNTMSKKWTSQGKPSAPYFLALRAAVECAGYRVVRAEEPNAKVNFIMSEQNEYERGALQMYGNMLDMQPPLLDKDVLLKPMVFGTHIKYPQLQAADLIAYHAYQYAKERRSNPDAVGTPLFRRLLRCAIDLNDFKFVTAEALDKLCSRFQFRKDEAEKIRVLRLSRLNSKVRHEPSQCTIIGRVDEGGNFLPQGHNI